MRFIRAAGRFLEENDGSVTARTELVNQALKRLPGWVQLLFPAGFFVVWLVMWAVLWVVVSTGELWLLVLMFGDRREFVGLVAIGNLIFMAVVAGIFLNWASAKLILWLDRRRSVVRV